MSPIVTTLLASSPTRGRVRAPQASGEASPFFQDTFESGSLGGGTINAETPGVFSYYNGSGVASAVDPISGAYSFAMAYPAMALGAGATGRNQERRFWIGRDLSEFWMEWKWRVPSNFVHRDELSSADNNKLFAFWRDSYSGANTLSWVAEFWRTSDTESYYRALATRSTTDFVGTAEVVFVRSTGNRFIHAAGPIVPGQTHTLRWHFRPSSAAGVLDGAYRMWIDGSLYFDTPTTHDLFNRSNRTDDNAVVRRGYLMGYTNSGYTDETTFTLDDIKFYDTNPGW